MPNKIRSVMTNRWKTPLRLAFMVVFVSFCVAGWWFRMPLLVLCHTATGGMERIIESKPQPDPKTYAILIHDLESGRIDLSERHRKAKTAAERAAVETKAKNLLERTLPTLMRCWLGTPWDFNGTAKGPGEGKIACGYFVATVLKDAGFQLDRYQLAQQSSGNIMRSFLPKDSCVLTCGEEYQSFASKMENFEPGVYIVGLDSHVAFIVVHAKGFRFIHSSGSRPWCVVDESRAEAGALQRSNWRMIGNLTEDSNVLRHWLKAEKIVVHGT